jgi:hypothetical protein
MLQPNADAGKSILFRGHGPFSVLLITAIPLLSPCHIMYLEVQSITGSPISLSAGTGDHSLFVRSSIHSFIQSDSLYL